MMEGDNEDSARKTSGYFSDDRIAHIWDAERRFGMLFAKTLNLKEVAWDVYLLFAPGITWVTDEPPEPTFWMHQLPAAAGADGKSLLNPGKFSRKLMNLLGSVDSHMARDLAFMLHVKGLGAVKREKDQSSLEDVLKAINPSQPGE